MIKLIKRLSKCVREYKLTSILSAVFVGLEVIMEVLIPLEMSKNSDISAKRKPRENTKRNIVCFIKHII